MSFHNPLLGKVHQIARTVHERGGRALLVGGFVRDEMLGKSPKDADVEVYGIESHKLRKILNNFGKVLCVGESFQVYKLVWRLQGTRYELDISLPRFDKKVARGHRGFEVQGDPHANTEDAARRRDFTINAMMKDPLTGEIIDHFNGREDLKKRVLRVVDAAHFAEDSLRVLRAMQFGARFEFEVESTSVEICRRIDLSDLPAERLWGEWEKLLMKSDKPSHGLRLGQQLGVFAQLFPYLNEALEKYGTQLCSTVDRAAAIKVLLSEYPRQITLMLASLGIYLSASNRKFLCSTLGIYTLDKYDVRHKMKALSKHGKTAQNWFARRDVIQDKDFRFLALEVEPRLIYLLARTQGSEAAAAWFWENVQRLGVEDSAPKPLLQGRHLLDLGLKPGPHFGEITKSVYEKQLEEGFNSLERAIEIAKLEINSSKQGLDSMAD